MHSRKKKTGKKDVCEETNEIMIILLLLLGINFSAPWDPQDAFSHIQLRELVYYSTFLFFNAVDK